MKVLVNVCVPAISEQFDVMIPDDMDVKEVISLLAEGVEKLSNYLYVSSGEECLCSVEQQVRLSSQAALKTYGIQNGDHLILM